jgi:chromosome segregation ATPase
LAAREAELARATADTADLRTALDERVAALQQTEGKIGERDAAIAMLQSELVAVRAELDQQHAAATELNAVRQTLVADVEQHEALLTTTRHELEELRRAAQERADALAVARKVGKAAIQALTIDTSVMPPGERSGWLHSIKRQFGLPE